MRFCFLTTFYPPWNFGGDGIQVQRLARALAGRGHHVTVLYSREGYAAMGGSDHEPPPEEPGIDVVAIDAGRGRWSPLVTYLTGRPLVVGDQLDRLLEEPYDVLHFHNPSLLGGASVLRKGDGLKVYTAHDQWLICPTHVLWQDRRRVCVDPHCTTCTLRYRRPPQLWRSTGLMRDAVAHLDLLLCPSATSVRLHKRFASDVRIEQLPHFLPDPGEPTPPAEPPDQDPYVVFAARLEEIKGAETLVRAFASWSRARLVIAGSGPLETALRAQAADLPHVEFVGWQDAEAMDGLYRGALAAVVPSVGHESFGLVVIESLARGIPAIVRDFGALGEFVTDSSAVLGFRTHDELLNALDQLVDEPHVRSERTSAARRDYLARWTESNHMRAYFELLAAAARARGDEELATTATGAQDGEPARR